MILPVYEIKQKKWILYQCIFKVQISDSTSSICQELSVDPKDGFDAEDFSERRESGIFRKQRQEWKANHIVIPSFF